MKISKLLKTMKIFLFEGIFFIIVSVLINKVTWKLEYGCKLFIIALNRCVTEEIKDPCTGDMDIQVHQAIYCGLLYHEHAFISPFRKCMAIIPDIAATMYKSCRYDVCSYFHDTHRVERVVCHALEGFAAECEERGISVKWRSEYFCRKYASTLNTFLTFIHTLPPF